jgi:hypothetical protein
MTIELDRLPPDQRAVLSLVLERGRSYSEVADMLAIPERTVRERAHAALDALAMDAASEAFAGEGESRAIAGVGAGASRLRASAELSSHGGSGHPPRRVREPGGRSTSASSRRAGLMLLGGLLVVIVIAVVLISSGGGKSSSTTTTKASTTPPSTTSSATKPTLDKTITLTPGEPELKASGIAYVLSEGNRRAFYVAAQGLPPSSGFFYAVWLYNSQSESTPLGKAPTVSSNGHMEGGGPLPSDADKYSKIIITRETSPDPKEPGPIVMTGAFGTH